VVLEQGTEVLLAILAEQEGIHAGTEFLERKVARCEERAALMRVVGVVQLVKQTSLAETKFERAELARQEVDDSSNIGRRDENAVETVNHAVGGEDVDGDEACVKVDRWALKRDTDGEALCVPKVLGGRVERGNGVAMEYAAGGVEVVDDVIEEDILEHFLRGVAAVLGNLLESCIRGSKDGIVRLCAVQELDEIVIFVNELGELGSIFALADELSMLLKGGDDVFEMEWTYLIDSPVGLTIMRRVMRSAVVWRMVRMVMVFVELYDGIIK
jgi:hypothetical protein